VAEALLEVRDLHMHFVVSNSVGRRLRRQPPEVLRAVDGVDIRIERGEVLGLVGESGCGKSTLGRCIVGLYEPTSGEISYAGQQLGAQRERAQRRRVQMVFQDPYSSLNPRMTVRQTLSELLRVHAMVPRNRVDERCRELVDLVGLGPRSLDAHPRQFSGGQRSGCRSPARWPWSRSCSSPTSRCPRSMCRCRRRCSTCSTSCARSWG